MKNKMPRGGSMTPHSQMKPGYHQVKVNQIGGKVSSFNLKDKPIKSKKGGRK